jgi:hypothetical protein
MAAALGHQERRVGSGTRLTQGKEAGVDLADIVVHRNPAFVVELSEWDMQGPLLLAEMA